MATKIRLQRQGKKGKPYYHVVVADARSPRDGRYIQRIGSYNPNTNPASIELKHDLAVDWLLKGAEPTDTARAILRYKGATYHAHLIRGVAKGAFSEEEAENRFKTWLDAKENKVQAKEDAVKQGIADQAAAAFTAESEIRAEREKARIAKQNELAGEENAEVTDADATEATEADVKNEEA